MTHLVARTRQAVKAKRFKDALLLYHGIEDKHDEVRRTLAGLPGACSPGCAREKASRRGAQETAAQKSLRPEGRLRANELMERRGRENLDVLYPRQPRTRHVHQGGGGRDRSEERSRSKDESELHLAPGSRERKAERWIERIKNPTDRRAEPAQVKRSAPDIREQTSVTPRRRTTLASTSTPAPLDRPGRPRHSSVNVGKYE